jgi:hypothetical protein
VSLCLKQKLHFVSDHVAKPTEDEVIAFGGIPRVSTMNVRTSARIQGQAGADDS